MNPSRIFIERPIATSLLMAALLLSGLMAYRILPISALPQIDYPTMQVSTLYPGASPEIIASTITSPLERQFGQMPGLKQMTSTSSGGASVITLQFTLEMTLDVAEQQVQAAINAANNLLPSDLPWPPIYSKINPADPPILTLAVTSDTLPMTRVQDLVDTRLSQKIAQLPGIGLVSLAGGQRPAVRIQVNPRALAAYGLGIDAVRSTIAAANVNQAKGSFDGPERAYSIDANDQIQQAAHYGDIILGYNNGAAVRVRDIGKVVDGAEDVRLAAWAGFKDPKSGDPVVRPAIIVNIQRQPGSNVIEVADRVKELLPRLRDTLPESVEVKILTDRTDTIRASIRDVRNELFMAIALVVAIMYVFLRNVPATIIPGVAVPLSLIGTFGIMYMAGFSINNLTLMALTIATGFVVDDAIVVIENVSRYIEEGDPPMEAALKGSAQIAFTIISLTFSLVAVLIPLLFMQDVVGRLFREFAITLAVSILLSAFISLTLTPMMCAYILRAKHEQKTPGRLEAVFEKGFEACIHWYDRWLSVIFQHQRITLAVAGMTLLLTLLMAWMIPKGFFPDQDTGIIQAISEAPQGTSFDSMSRRQAELSKLILEDPDVDSLSSIIGVDGVNSTLNSGRLLINLKPLEDRDSSAPAIVRRLTEESHRLYGINAYMQPVQNVTIEDRISHTQYQMVMGSIYADELHTWVPRLLDELKKEPALRDTASDMQERGRQAFVNINRDTAGRLGIKTSDIDNALYDAFGQRIISTIFTQSNQYRVILEVDPEFRRNPQDLRGIYIPTPDGGQVPLHVLGSVEERFAPLAIMRQGQFPAVTVSFNLAPGSSLGEAVDTINAVEKKIGLPATISTAFQGAASAFQAALANEAWLVLAAVVTMYIVLGVLYESYAHPITILSTLPSAGVGALLALMLAHMDLGVVSIIGIILLIGIVKKNAIMMIDFALEAEREEGLPPLEAIHKACLLRFRPILMTTAAALFGALPLMLGTGMGAELRRPLGVTMVGGLLFSQLLTLFTTPVIYLAIESISRRLGFGQPKEDDEDAPPKPRFTPHQVEKRHSERLLGESHHHHKDEHHEGDHHKREHKGKKPGEEPA